LIIKIMDTEKVELEGKDQYKRKKWTLILIKVWNF
jgi:hypothetical protein